MPRAYSYIIHQRSINPLQRQNFRCLSYKSSIHPRNPSSPLNAKSKSIPISDADEYSKYNSKAISWYPGHIAKAERELTDYLGKVDVVVEVRDARIPLATTHPKVLDWIGKKPVIVVILRIDQISPKALKAWKTYYSYNSPHFQNTKNARDDAKVFFINGKLGTNVPSLKQEILKAGVSVNERRRRKGIEPRAVRAAVIGYPNVGKSALINRLLGRVMAKSRNLPGVTKSLTWVRLGTSLSSINPDKNINQEDVIELLDSPGIIPAKQLNQENAVKLAICNDIGQASYDRVLVAGEMCNLLNKLHKQQPGIVDMNKIIERYNLPFPEMTGEDILYKISEKCQDNLQSAADKLLADFRKNYLTYASLEYPDPASLKQIPLRTEAKSFVDDKIEKLVLTVGDENDDSEVRFVAKDSSLLENNETTEEKTIHSKSNPSDEDIVNLDIGRGSYDGW